MKNINLTKNEPAFDAYEDFRNPVCDCLDKTDGTCNCDYDCVYQRGKWKDACALWKKEEAGNAKE